jgi:NAD(P)-dependent dehydrogenase (short-subunit alcohol dehydrogenase family)
VTGGAKGIGAGIARALSEAGARVIIADVAEPGREADGLDCTFIHCDVSQPEQVAGLVGRTVKETGRLDILVNNAGLTGGSGPFLGVSLTDWNRYISVNLTGAFLVGQAAARAMVAGQLRGRIVNIGSINSFAAERSASPYVASKGGLLLLTKAMAVDLAPYGILVNCVAPGPITVERNDAIFNAEPLRTRIMHAVPLGAPGNATDIASAVVFLVSDANQFITGASLLIDGGQTAVLNFD